MSSFITMKEMKLLIKLELNELDLLGNIFEGHKLKGNKLSSFVQIILEIKEGQGISMEKIFNDPKIQNIQVQ